MLKWKCICRDMSHVGWRSTTPGNILHRLRPDARPDGATPTWPTNAPGPPDAPEGPLTWPTNIPVPGDYFWHRRQ
ncbi:hypothetical protein MJ579_27770 [Klebsiella pneumoniae]|nr:hypothetical protein MJ579_27770 [Klebsiella pneumoniae]